MFVKVTTSLNKIVHTSNSPEKNRHFDRAPDRYVEIDSWVDRQTDLPLRSSHLSADWLCGVAAWHTAESLSSPFQSPGAATEFSVPPTDRETDTHTRIINYISLPVKRLEQISYL